MAELMRLRVPTGWWLVRNELVDASPLDPSVPRNTFSDTMLYAERGVPHGRDDRFIVDVSWKPANDPSGHYKLTAVAGSWERVLGVFVTEDREALRAVLEAWLAELA
ncbi:MAG TPA: hypothetical protein PKA64_11980, partial [Myxococcota bacterium]|nr:hypothetical protein [Myxococcota bacterium]